MRNNCSIIKQLVSDFDDVCEHRQVFKVDDEAAETNFTIA